MWRWRGCVVNHLLCASGSEEIKLGAKCKHHACAKVCGFLSAVCCALLALHSVPSYILTSYYTALFMYPKFILATLADGFWRSYLPVGYPLFAVSCL